MTAILNRIALSDLQGGPYLRGTCVKLCFCLKILFKLPCHRQHILSICGGETVKECSRIMTNQEGGYTHVYSHFTLFSRHNENSITKRRKLRKQTLQQENCSLNTIVIYQFPGFMARMQTKGCDSALIPAHQPPNRAKDPAYGRLPFLRTGIAPQTAN